MDFIVPIKKEKSQDILNGKKIEKDFINFIKIVGKTKKIRRTGWKRKAKIKFGETIAEHMYGVAMLSMIISDNRNLNTEKVLRMSLLHDLVEVITGDLTPTERAKIGVKKSIIRERNALEKILDNFPQIIRNNYIGIWNEIQCKDSEESKLVNSMDKFEMAIQAIEYIEKGHDKNVLIKFIESAQDKINDAQLLRILKSLKYDIY